MVIDARIPMSGNPINFFDTYTTGVQRGQQQKANALGMQQAQTDQKARTAQMLAKGVLSSPDPASAYSMALEQARRIGMNVEGLPTEWGPDAEMAVRLFAADPAEMTTLQKNLEAAGLKPGSDEYRAAVLSSIGMGPAKDPIAKERALLALSPEERAALGVGGKTMTDPTLIREMVAAGFEPGTPEFRAEYERRTAKGGLTVYDPTTGKPLVSTGGVSKTTNTDLEGREVDARDTLARLDRIKQNIIDNPDIINLGRYAERFGAGVLNEMDKLGVDLNAEDRKFLEDMTAARGDILENLNFTIKAITGAAMTEAEAKRIGETLPGVTDGPVVFQAKLERAIEAQRMAVARYNYWRTKGMGGKPWEFETLSGMKNLIKKRGEELAKAVREKTMTAEDAEATFFKEFGI